jgi:hypothetical protein
MTARRHHYLPQCYLKGFGKPRQRGKAHYVQVFDRSGKAFRTNIINVAAEKDFNRVEVDGHPPDAVEQEIAKFESQIGPALVRILQARSLANEDDRILLFNLIAAMATRNPRLRENIRDFHERVSDLIMQAATATKERWEGQLRQMKAKGYVPKHNVPYEKLREFVTEKKYRIEVPTERHIGYEFGMFDAVLPTLFNRNWMVLLTRSNKSAGFVTCDHPVCLMFSDPKKRGRFHGPGHGLSNTELIFPVGRGMAIVGAYEITEQTIELDEDGVAGINGAMVAFAERQVFAADAEFSYSRQPNETPRRGTSLVNDRLFRRTKR